MHSGATREPRGARAPTLASPPQTKDFIDDESQDQEDEVDELEALEALDTVGTLRPPFARQPRASSSSGKRS